MTTIVYSHKTRTIACDSRVCAGTNILSDTCKKFVEREGVMFFVAGAVSDIELLIELYFSPESVTEHLEAQAIVVDQGVVYATEFTNKSLNLVPITYDDAIGSGGTWALAALDFGCDVKGAIAYAKKKDSCTGGRIRVFRV